MGQTWNKITRYRSKEARILLLGKLHFLFTLMIVSELKIIDLNDIIVDKFEYNL